MRRWFIRLARLIWAATPFKSVKELYWRVFLLLVRSRKTIATVEGMTYELDLGEVIDANIFLEKFERDIVGLVENYCQEGWVVIDVGANIGAHCLRFAKLAGSTGRVYAFEPTNYAFKKLVKNISLNSFDCVVPLQLALSENNLTDQKVSFRSSWRSNGKHIVGTSTVDFVRLDDWCAEHKVDQIHLIKLDVDGNEYSVLSGATGMIRRSRPLIIMEVGAWHFQDPARNPLEILRMLKYHFWDTKTLVEYSDLSQIRKLLPREDPKMAVSINVMAGCRFPEARRV
jgi:FkbM family methyltransferase